MSKMHHARIAGTGMCVPEKVVTNKDLEKLMDTTDEWIQKRSGIKERRYTENGVGPSDLAYEASTKAIKAANLTAEQIDLVIVTTLSPDYYFPGTSAFLQDMLGMSTTPSFDIKAQCTGFLYGLNVGRALIATGQYENVLLCGTEVHSAAIDFSTAGRDVTVLFGDGAGAAVIQKTDDADASIKDIQLHSEGKYRDKLKIEFPSTRQKPMIDNAAIERGAHFPYMEGRYVFKHAVHRLTEVIVKTLADNDLNANDIDMYVLHQANLRINEAVLDHLGVPREKSYNTIQKYGNCSSASIPIGLDECVRGGLIKPGSKVCMAAFGAGFTWGASVVTF